MTLGRPRPFVEAYEFAENRGLLPTSLNSAQLERLPVEIRTNAVFSSGVTEAEILQMIQDETAELVKGVSPGPGQYTDKATIRLRLKKLLVRMDYQPSEGDEGTIKDLRSDARLNLIIEMQVRMAQGFGQMVQQTTAAALVLYPCWELVRVEPRRVPRGWRLVQAVLRQVDPQFWQKRWVKAGGTLYKGRMVATKSDPVWAKLSRFGVPWPPFDYNSGMGLRQISRREALAIGIGLDQLRNVTQPGEGTSRGGAEARKEASPASREIVTGKPLHSLGKDKTGTGSSRENAKSIPHPSKFVSPLRASAPPREKSSPLPSLNTNLQAQVGGLEAQLNRQLADILGPLFKVTSKTASLKP